MEEEQDEDTSDSKEQDTLKEMEIGNSEKAGDEEVEKKEEEEGDDEESIESLIRKVRVWDLELNLQQRLNGPDCAINAMEQLTTAQHCNSEVVQ